MNYCITAKVGNINQTYILVYSVSALQYNLYASTRTVQVSTLNNYSIKRNYDSVLFQKESRSRGKQKKLPRRPNDPPHCLLVLFSNLLNDHGHFDEVKSNFLKKRIQILMSKIVQKKLYDPPKFVDGNFFLAYL